MVVEPRMPNIVPDRSDIKHEQLSPSQRRDEAARVESLARRPAAVRLFEEERRRRDDARGLEVRLRRLQYVERVLKVVVGVLVPVDPPEVVDERGELLCCVGVEGGCVS